MKQCAQCGASIPDSAPGGHCGACLLEGMLGGLQDPLESLGDSSKDKSPSLGSIGPFQLVRHIGDGGFGDVYLAEQLTPVRRRVAVKILKPERSTDLVVSRFEAERQALAMMDHPNISSIYDAGQTEDGRPYFAMEYVEGAPITSFCEEHRLTTNERLEVFVQICDAIQFAHQKGIIHRDLKPSNLLVQSPESGSRYAVPKVIDFGIAKALDEPLTEKTLYTEAFRMVGTPAYMSPEQTEMTSQDLDVRSDIYSLGVVLYELLTGTTPFTKEQLETASFTAVIRMLRESEPPKPSTRLVERSQAVPASGISLPAVDRDLDWIVMKALEKDPDRRYVSAAAFADDIRRHLKSEPVNARPPSAAYRLQRFTKRNKAAVVGATASVLVLIAGTIVSVLQAHRAIDAEAVAVQVATEYRDLHYIANMNLIMRDWEESNVGRVRRLLDETKDYPNRGFEWHYWHRKTHLERLKFSDHVGAVTGVAIFPDGRRVASVGVDGMVRVWTTDNGEIEFEQSSDNIPLHCVAISDSGRLIVAGGADGRLYFWDAVDRQRVAVRKCASKTIRSVDFTPEGEFVVCAGDDTRVNICRVDPWRRRNFKEHTSRISFVDVAPDGSQVVTASWDQTCRLWRPDGELVSSFRVHGNDGIRAAVFSPDAAMVASASWDQTVKLWEPSTGDVVQTLEGHVGRVECVIFSNDGSLLASGGQDQTVRVWDVRSGNEVLIARGHEKQITAVLFINDDTELVTTSEDGTVRIWNLEAIEKESDLGEHANSWVSSLAISRDNRFCVTGSGDHTLKIWDLSNRTEKAALNDGHRGGVWSVACSPDGRHIMSSAADAQLISWDLHTGAMIDAFEVGSSNDHFRIAYAPGGSLVALAAVNGRMAEIRRVEDGALVRQLVGHGERLMDLGISPDGTRLATASYDKSVRVWEMATGRELMKLQAHQDRVNSVEFSPDGRFLVSGSADQAAIVYDAVTGDVLLTLLGHTGEVFSSEFSPDSKRVVTGSFDTTVKLWELEYGREVLTLKGHTANVWAARFSPNGRSILTGGWDGKVMIWEAD